MEQNSKRKGVHKSSCEEMDFVFGEIDFKKDNN